jgi:diacylglycerol kinase (ATP)
MAKTGNTGLARIIKAAGYSKQGLQAAWVNEAAFRQEGLLALVMIPVAFWVADNSIELILLISAVLLVLIVELLNSAVEAVVDRIGDEHHELSGRAKDIGSAAVFISLVLTLVVWTIIVLS